MRRVFAFFVAVSALGSMTSAAFGQYPYPYGPMPVQYTPPYGYPMPMPAYVPNQMMPQPMYYPQPAMMQPPMMQPPAGRNTKVFVYGPLTDDPVPFTQQAPVAPMPYPQPLPAKSDPAASSVTQAQAVLMRGGPRTLPTYSKADLAPEACGPGGDDSPPMGYLPKAYEPPMRGRGHFIGEAGANFLVPIISNRTAFTTTANGVTTNTEFPRQVDFGPHGSFGYMFHTGWGVRGDYDYLNGSISQATNNTTPATAVRTPLIGPFQINSPGTSLNAGIGIDQFNTTQRLERHIADIEFLKETHVLDTTFLFGAGGRYTRLTQSYAASRINPGGGNAVVNVAVDREDVDSTHRFEGWGPTVSMEMIHPLRHGFSIYGDVRGSFLWGKDVLARSYHYRNRGADNVGNVNFTDTALANDVHDHRYVPSLDTELGIQYGCRVGRCYVYARTGVNFQRWWDVGSPNSSGGIISFIGGSARLGITY